ncbi:MAG: hypothetical protein OXS28_02250 [Gammaproteobacteria bacterium]|nr:hypothetical protein [Gammaproteobacteria bacterium]MDE0285852.1 hypothetical protein [Gammaproteobacteria bacterium]
MGAVVMAFWEWVSKLHEMVQDRSDFHIIERIAYFILMGDIPTGSAPRTYADIKDVLAPLGFDRDELKQVRDLWIEYSRH